MKLSDSNKDMISSLIILGGVVAFLIWYFKRDTKESNYSIFNKKSKYSDVMPSEGPKYCADARHCSLNFNTTTMKYSCDCISDKGKEYQDPVQEF